MNEPKRPPLRKEYAPYIKELLKHAPAEWLAPGYALNTMLFLRKLADYIESERFNVITTNNKERVTKWKTKQQNPMNAQL